MKHSPHPSKNGGLPALAAGAAAVTAMGNSMAAAQDPPRVVPAPLVPVLDALPTADQAVSQQASNPQFMTKAALFDLIQTTLALLRYTR